MREVAVVAPRKAGYLKTDNVVGLNGLLIAAAINIVLGPAWGALSDKLAVALAKETNRQSIEE